MKPEAIEKLAGTAVLCLVLVMSAAALWTLGDFLSTNIGWMREKASEMLGKDKDKDELLMHVLHLHASLIRRCIGIFAGAFLAIAGLGFSWYTTKTVTSLSGESSTAKLLLTTASPGLVGVVAGVILIGWVVSSKDQFGNPATLGAHYGVYQAAPQAEVDLKSGKDGI